MFQVGGKNETWHKDAFGELKFTGSHAKINLKVISYAKILTGVSVTTWPPMNCKISLKDLSKPQDKHHKNVMKNVTHCLILNGKELPIHWLTIADVFCDVFVMFIWRSLNALHFRRGHVVIETSIKKKKYA